MKVNKFTVAMVAFLLSFVTAVGAATASSPVQMLKSVANRMIRALEQNKSQLKRNPAIIHRIVNSILLPHIDVNRMAGSVVGRNYWRQATPSQRRTFVNQFKRLVINTYSDALASYNGDKVKFYPIRGGYQGRSYTRVNSVIIRLNGQRIPISYNVVKTSGGWKVYDFSIESVSIVQNYRAQFSGTLSQGGMALLITKLRKYNRGR